MVTVACRGPCASTSGREAVIDTHHFAQERAPRDEPHDRGKRLERMLVERRRLGLIGVVSKMMEVAPRMHDELEDAVGVLGEGSARQHIGHLRYVIHWLAVF